MVLRQLARQVDRALRCQEVRRASPLEGAYIHPDWGLDDPSHTGTASMLAGAAWLALWGPAHRRDHYWHRAELAAHYLLRVQRASGRIDLKSCNFDSAPDTAFVVQLLCAVLEHSRSRPAATALNTALERFIRSALPGIMEGGFHTPNHRWVIASALVQTRGLFPELEVTGPLNAYLAEGIDQDPHGAFQERSPTVYDAVTTRSLWFLHRMAGWTPAQPAIERNLRLNLLLLHPDGTIETGLSRRQDRDRREVPASLAPVFLLQGEVRLARQLWSHVVTPSLSDCFWLAYAQRTQVKAINALREPRRHATHFDSLGIWRVRQGPLSATIFRGVSRLVHGVAGDIELVALKISQSYFGCGRFLAEQLTVLEDGRSVCLRSSGRTHPRRPGYDLPLGETVPVDTWDDWASRRSVRALPPATSELVITRRTAGFDFHYRTEDNWEGVPAQIALDFAPGGIWCTPEGEASLEPGSVHFLPPGGGMLRQGRHTLTLSGGSQAHRMVAMRDAEGPGTSARILVPLITPVDFHLRLRLGLRQTALQKPAAST